MRKYKSSILVIFFIASCASDRTNHLEEKGFVTVLKNQFIRDGKPYHFLGTNFWYGANLGSEGSGGNRKRLIRELDRLAKMGVTNLRIMGGSEGPDTEPYRMVPAMQTSRGNYNPQILEGLDFLLAEMGKRSMVAVVCLNNFWNWSGGMGQYLVWAGAADSIPYPPPHPGGDWGRYQTFTAQFYSNAKAVSLFNDHIRYLLNRVNSITGKLYKEDPVIMAWELANEPRGVNNQEAYLKWVNETAGLIHSVDSHHLVTTGSEGNTSSPFAGTRLSRDHAGRYIDYATMHIWVQNWNYYDPQKADSTYAPALAYALGYMKDHIAMADSLGKPLVLEEFGISRDKNNHSGGSPVTIRDAYYTNMFEAVEQYIQAGNSPLAGCNFWAWAGEGRPRVPGDLWKPGDDFIGDPPHESQGWYSVFDSDSSTIRVIREYAQKIGNSK